MFIVDWRGVYVFFILQPPSCVNNEGSRKVIK